MKSELELSPLKRALPYSNVEIVPIHTDLCGHGVVVKSILIFKFWPLLISFRDWLANKQVAEKGCHATTNTRQGILSIDKDYSEYNFARS